jgi:hypothetical protein
MTHLAPFSNYGHGGYAPGRACSSPCFSAAELLYAGKKISYAHTGRGSKVKRRAFDRFLTHFREALNEVGVEAEKVKKSRETSKIDATPS